MTAVDYTRPNQLDGRSFVILGAGGSGIGTATCEAMAQAGARLLCVDRDGKEAQAAAKACGGVPFVADVQSRNDMNEVFAAADREFGARFSGVVDIVGVARTGLIENFDDDGLARQFDIILRHALLAIQIAAPLLARRGGGTMAFVGSMSGDRVTMDQSIYGIAKAALHHLVRTAACELGPQNIRVNAVAPGLVKTPRLLALLPKETWDGIAAVNPLRRCATPADIARALLYLSSDLSDYVNGNVLRLDGGYGNSWSLPGLDIPRGEVPLPRG